MSGVIGFALATVLLIFIWIMLWDSNRFVVRHYSCSTGEKKLCRFVFLSDLHSKEYGKNNEKLLQAIKDADPDFVLVGGDMFNAKPGAKTEKTVSFLKLLASEYPVYYAMGNHEYRARIYPETYGTLYSDYRDALKDSGIVFLDNESVDLEGFAYPIRVSGLSVDRQYYKRFQKHVLPEEYAASLLGPALKTSYQILLAHNPVYMKGYAQWNPDLILSGHVHGGVVKLGKLGGVISPSLTLFPHYDGGLYDEFGTRMIVSRGLGAHTVPVRLFNPGELIVTDIYRKDEAEE